MDFEKPFDKMVVRFFGLIPEFALFFFAILANRECYELAKGNAIRQVT
jgi:hypothetical protein